MMNMLMDIVKVSSSPEVTGGGWTFVQDPESGAVQRTWVTDNATENAQTGVIKDVPCLARGVLGTGIKGVGSTESFESVYTNVDWVKVRVSPDTNITKRDRVTRIRDAEGNVVWKENEVDGEPATVFNVMGITPVPGPFGAVMEYSVLLKRAEVQ